MAGDENHQIIAYELRNTDVDDPSALADLLKQLDASSHYFIADDTYDGMPVIQAT